jgi:hypothetical protein
LVSTDISQLIQNIIGISWLTSVDTINHIFCIGYTMSVDTNNVILRRQAAQFSHPLRRCLPLCHTIDATSLGASAASLDTAPLLSPSSTPSLGDPAFDLDTAGGVPIVVPDPVVPSPTSLTPSLRIACTRCVILLASRLPSRGSKSGSHLGRACKAGWQHLTSWQLGGTTHAVV